MRIVTKAAPICSSKAQPCAWVMAWLTPSWNLGWWFFSREVGEADSWFMMVNSWFMMVNRWLMMVNRWLMVVHSWLIALVHDGEWYWTKRIFSSLTNMVTKGFCLLDLALIFGLRASRLKVSQLKSDPMRLRLFASGWAALHVFVCVSVGLYAWHVHYIYTHTHLSAWDFDRQPCRSTDCASSTIVVFHNWLGDVALPIAMCLLYLLITAHHCQWNLAMSNRKAYT